ncbi:hypothetical protein [Enterococcus sp. DIV1420a]|uniref:hypothetical protein n=1 Tax=Enterococcus sp. DIV1420a TaxID=2774672 RepID=UPI0036D6CD0B
MKINIDATPKEIAELFQTVEDSRQQRYPKNNPANVTITGKELGKVLNEEIKCQHRQFLGL